MNKTPLSESLIEKDTYQVLVCSSPANVIVGFAAHTWFLVNRKGSLAHFEVLHFKKDRSNSNGYMHKDYFDYFMGIEIWQGYTKYHWKGSVIGVVSGNENSAASDMINLIESSFTQYPFVEKYSLIGPNSNTYTKWILDHFPEINISLPWNAFGRNYKYQNISKLLQ